MVGRHGNTGKDDASTADGHENASMFASPRFVTLCVDKKYHHSEA